MTDRELQNLRRQEKRRIRRAKLAEEKRSVILRIADLTAKEYIQSFKMREQLFSDENRLLHFVRRTVARNSPTIWYVFQKYCANEGFDLANAVSIAAGHLEDFEQQREFGEKLRLDAYLARLVERKSHILAARGR